MEEVILLAKDNYQLRLNVYEVDNPRGFVQVVHGMEEHQERYKYCAEFLNKAGFVVITSDTRGHGKYAEELGYITGNNGGDLIIDDQLRITQYIKERYHVNKISLYGHSMGSIIVRNLLLKHSSEYQKVIISGYVPPIKIGPIAIAIANCMIKFKGEKSRSKMLENLTVGGFNKAIKNPKTNYDWLSYNEENIQNYINDPLCGSMFTIGAYKSLYELVTNMSSSKNYQNVNKDLYILCIRGEDDPCVGGEKASLRSRKVLSKAGFKNIADLKFKNARHEVLHEDIKDNILKEMTIFLS